LGSTDNAESNIVSCDYEFDAAGSSQLCAAPDGASVGTGGTSSDDNVALPYELGDNVVILEARSFRQEGGGSIRGVTCELQVAPEC
jgi:hypothetical protein